MRLPAALLALLVVTAGCSVLSEDRPPSDQRALDVRDRALAAADDVSTYRYSLDGRVTASDGSDRRTVAISGTGVVSRPEQRLVSNVTTDDETRAVYVDGRTVYTQCRSPWGGYGVENASESPTWFGLTPLGRELSVFERSSVYWRGTETLDGARTYLVVAHPTTETLQSLPDADSRSVDYSRGDIDNATFKLWVDAETYRPVKSSIRIELSSGDASATASMTTRYRDYDAPVRATIPDMTEATRYRLGCPKA